MLLYNEKQSPWAAQDRIVRHHAHHVGSFLLTTLSLAPTQAYKFYTFKLKHATYSCKGCVVFRDIRK